MRFLAAPVFLALSSAPLSAAIVYNGNVGVTANPTDTEGVYLNLSTGATATLYPADFDTSPWVNLTLGGYGFFNSELINPVATVGGASYNPNLTTDYYPNLVLGTLLNSSTTFIDNAWGSGNHVGTGNPNLFANGGSGYIGFEFQKTGGGDTFYGWLHFSVSSVTGGTILDWAYNDTPGGSIAVGAVPEPSASLLAMVSAGALAFRRRSRGSRAS